MPQVRRRRPRLPPAQYVGKQRYLLTICCSQRQQHFADAQNVEQVCKEILRTATANQVAILAYCFMPDHLHLLAEGLTETADLTRFVKLAKQRTGYAFRRRHDAVLWQESWHDHIIRPSEDPKAALRYLLENPLRAGLTRTVADYPHIGSGTMTRDALLGSAGL